jgi:hypothetical protein
MVHCLPCSSQKASARISLDTAPAAPLASLAGGFFYARLTLLSEIA